MSSSHLLIFAAGLLVGWLVLPLLLGMITGKKA